MTTRSALRSLLLPALLLGCGACAHDPQSEIARSVVPLPHPGSLRAAFDGMRGPRDTSGVAPLTDNGRAWAVRWEMVESARMRIDATTFIIEHDAFGDAFLGALIERAEHGVHVTLLVDGRGSAPILLPLAGLEEMRAAADAGVEVRIYNPPLEHIVPTIVSASITPLVAGSHQKILAVDERIAVAGGRNLSAAYFTSPREDPHAILDADVAVDGARAVAEMTRLVGDENETELLPRSSPPLADTGTAGSESPMSPARGRLLLMRAAMDAWLHGDVAADAHAAENLAAWAFTAVPAAPASLREELKDELAALARAKNIHGRLPLPPLTAHEMAVKVVSAPSKIEWREANDDASDAIIRAIMGARDHITFESPYLLMTPRLFQALKAASARGVRIDVLTNSAISTDNEMSQALFVDTWPHLEEEVPTLRIWVSVDSHLMHAKRAVFDDDLTLIGSYNLDPLSAHLNSELIVFAWDPDLAHQTRNEIEELMQQGLEYRVARNESGSIAHDDHGNPIISFGPDDHLTAQRMAELRSLKRALFSLEGIWSFQWIAW